MKPRPSIKSFVSHESPTETHRGAPKSSSKTAISGSAGPSPDVGEDDCGCNEGTGVLLASGEGVGLNVPRLAVGVSVGLAEGLAVGVTVGLEEGAKV